MLEITQLTLAIVLMSTPGAQTDEQAPAVKSPTALIIAIRGQVTQSPNPKAEQKVARPLDLISEGDLLRLEKNARVDLLVGQRWLSFEGSGDLKLQRGRWVHSGSVRRTRAKRLPNGLPAQELNAWSVSTHERGEMSLSIESPRETAIRDARPTLKWRALPGPQTVRLDLLAVVDGRLEVVESWRGLRERELRVHRALKPETLYLWRVADQGQDSKSEDHAWFIIRSPKRIEALEGWVRALEELRSSHVEDRQVAESLLAVALERLGLLEEARSSWRALASQGRILDIASKRSARLQRRILSEPRDHPIFPLPFQIRLPQESSESRRPTR